MATPDPSTSPPAGPPPALAGMHHVTAPVTDLDVSCSWYERTFGAHRIPDLDHHDDTGRRFAVVLDVPGLGTMLQLRLDARAAAGTLGFEPSTFAVADLDLLADWVAHLDALGIAHSPVTRRKIGSAVTLTSPDGAQISLYSRPPADAG